MPPGGGSRAPYIVGRWSSDQEIATSSIHATFIDHRRIKPTLLGRWGTLLGRQGGSQLTCAENQTRTGYLGLEQEPNKQNRKLSAFQGEKIGLLGNWAGRLRRFTRSSCARAAKPPPQPVFACHVSELPSEKPRRRPLPRSRRTDAAWLSARHMSPSRR